MECGRVEYLGEEVGVIELALHVFDFDNLPGYELAHFKEAPIDVSRPVARFAVAGELDSSCIVDAQGGRSLLLQTHFTK